jgi:hypothetical protein
MTNEKNLIIIKENIWLRNGKNIRASVLDMKALQRIFRPMATEKL